MTKGENWGRRERKGRGKQRSEKRKIRKVSNWEKEIRRKIKGNCRKTTKTM